MSPNVIVVSLKGATARRKRMLTLLAARGLPFVFFDAHDGRQSHVANRALAELPNAGRLYPGELGCALSHIDVWRRIASADGNGLTLIVEDDVHLSAGFENEWKSLARSKLPPGIYRFETMLASVNMKIAPVWTGRSCAFHPLLSAHGGTAAYALNREVASRLVAESTKIREAIDIELFHPLRSNIQMPNVYQAFPGQVIQDMLLPATERSPDLVSQIVERRDLDVPELNASSFRREYPTGLRNAGRSLRNLLISAKLRQQGLYRRVVKFDTTVP